MHEYLSIYPSDECRQRILPPVALRGLGAVLSVCGVEELGCWSLYGLNSDAHE